MKYDEVYAIEKHQGSMFLDSDSLYCKHMLHIDMENDGHDTSLGGGREMWGAERGSEFLQPGGKTMPEWWWDEITWCCFEKRI